MKQTSLCLLLFVLGHTLVHAEEQELVLEEPGLQHSKGVIIELEEESSGQEEKTSKRPARKFAEKNKKAGKRQVELIVGGQGEDGIAKRSSLIIND